MSSNSTNLTLPFDDVGVAVSASFILVFLVVGVVGNALTITVITTYRSLYNNIFLNFILSLCVSDLISALISWLFLYRRTWGFNSWDLPEFLCKLYWSVDFLTNFVTACHILSFSILRLLSIRATNFFLKIHLHHARIWIAMIWIICIGAGLVPSLFIFGPRMPDRSTNQHNARWPACTILTEWIDRYKVYTRVSFSIFLYVPLFGVVITCATIVWLVYSRSKLPINSRSNKKRKEKQAVLQLLLIIASFLIGYIPFSAYELWSLQEHPNTEYIRRTDYWFGMIEYLFLRFSECLNPLFYNFGSAKVRKHTKKFLNTKFCWCSQKEKTTFPGKSKTTAEVLSTNKSSSGV